MLEIDGVVKSSPVPKEEPPPEAANQEIVPEFDSASNVTVPGPQRESASTSEIVG